MSPAQDSRSGSPGAWSHDDGRRRCRPPRRPGGVVATGYGAGPMPTTTSEALGADRIVVPLAAPLDLGRTCARFAQGRRDPCNRFIGGEVWRTTRTPEGPATLRLGIVSGQLVAQAWGPGRGWALGAAAGTAGLHDPAETFDPPAGAVRRLNRRAPGLRIPATGRLLEILVPTVIAQKVTGQEAFSAWSNLVRMLSGPAPGPTDLLLPPAADDLADLPGYRYHPVGMERRRAETIRRVAARADWLEEALDLPLAEMYGRVTSVPGVGWWTAAESLSVAAGDADAVQVGDFHLPNQVAWNLAGEPRADDSRMIDLLDPYRGHRRAASSGWWRRSVHARRPTGPVIASGRSGRCEPAADPVSRRRRLWYPESGRRRWSAHRPPDRPQGRLRRGGCGCRHGRLRAPR